MKFLEYIPRSRELERSVLQQRLSGRSSIRTLKLSCTTASCRMPRPPWSMREAERNRLHELKQSSDKIPRRQCDVFQRWNTAKQFIILLNFCLGIKCWNRVGLEHLTICLEHWMISLKHWTICLENWTTWTETMLMNLPIEIEKFFASKLFHYDFLRTSIVGFFFPGTFEYFVKVPSPTEN